MDDSFKIFYYGARRHIYIFIPCGVPQRGGISAVSRLGEILFFLLDSLHVGLSLLSQFFKCHLILQFRLRPGLQLFVLKVNEIGPFTHHLAIKKIDYQEYQQGPKHARRKFSYSILPDA
jgi:hypothetical protein